MLPCKAFELSRDFKFQEERNPDFISTDGSLGLEVVNSKFEKWKQLDSIVHKHFNQGLSANEIKRRVDSECKNGFEGSIYSIGNVAAYSPVKDGAFDTGILVNRVIEIIREKTNLLMNYQKCNKYWLYIFTETSLIDETEVEKINISYQNSKDIKIYDRIFILVPPRIYILEYGKEISRRRFTRITNSYLSKKAKKISGL